MQLGWVWVLVIALALVWMSVSASLFPLVSEKAMRLLSRRKKLVTVAAAFLFAEKASGLVSEMPPLSLAWLSQSAICARLVPTAFFSESVLE